MSEYSELIKNFSRIRDYMREFFVFGFNLKLEFYGADTDLLFLKKKANLHETILARKLFELLAEKLKKTNSLRSPLCNVCSGPHCQSGASQTNKRVTYSQKNCHFFDLSIIRPIIKRPPLKRGFFRGDPNGMNFELLLSPEYYLATMSLYEEIKRNNIGLCNYYKHSIMTFH